MNLNEIMSGMQAQMVLFITGGNRDVFTDEQGKQVPYGMVFAGTTLEGENAFGFKADKYKCEPHVVDVCKTYGAGKLYTCKDNIRQVGATGQSIRILDAVPHEAQAAVTPKPTK